MRLRPGLALRVLALALLVCPITFGSVSVLLKEPGTRTEKIPVVIKEAGSGKMSLGWIELQHDNLSEDELGDDTFIKFTDGSDDPSTDDFRAQLWVAVLAAAAAWQEPWHRERWTITKMPRGDCSGNGAALAIGLISSSCAKEYPKDTVVFGRLNPDGSLGLVSHLADLISAAAQAGMKRVIIPELERMESSDRGAVTNIPELAERLGLECVTVDSLREATRAMLDGTLPAPPALEYSPRYSTKVLSLFYGKCQDELDQLKPLQDSWPKQDEHFQSLSQAERILWHRVFLNFGLGKDCYRSGQTSSAYWFLREAHADLYGIQSLFYSKESFSFSEYNDRGNAIREKMLLYMDHPLMDRNELQSALILAQREEWLRGLNARVEGAQMLARQCFDSRSEATANQKHVAEALLVDAVKAAEYELSSPDGYDDLFSLVKNEEQIPVYNRATTLVSQLEPAEFGTAEAFVAGLKNRASGIGDSLIYDPLLFSFGRILRDSESAWRQEQPGVVIASDLTHTRPVKVGFVPGPGYAVPRSPVAPPSPSHLSETARCLIWANDYSEVAMLDQKYLQLDGSFDSEMLEWTVQNRGALQDTLQFADLGAQRGIILAKKSNVDTSVLEIIYEMASCLRASEDNNLRLEGLRQYWRCALLGNMCWQLGYIPRAMVAPAEPAVPVTEPTLSVPADGRLKIGDSGPAKSSPPKPDPSATAASKTVP